MTKEMRKYENTLEDIEKTLGVVPGFMKFFPREKLIRDWPSWKSLGEIDMERASYLLNTDELLEEMLDKTHSKITNNVNVEFSMAGTVRYEELVDTELVA